MEEAASRINISIGRTAAQYRAEPLPQPQICRCTFASSSHYLCIQGHHFQTATEAPLTKSGTGGGVKLLVPRVVNATPTPRC